MNSARIFAVATVGTAAVMTGLQSWFSPHARDAQAQRPPAEGRPVHRAAPPAGVSLVAKVIVPTIAVYRRPRAGRPRLRLHSITPAGSTRVLLVRARRAGWIEVWLPIRPNGSHGWVHASDVALARDDWRVSIRLRVHRLLVLRDAHRVWSMPTADGAGATPTPTGRFFVTELLRQPDPLGPYGPWVFALSAFSPVLTHFRGGDGEVGIHGTDKPSLLGHDVSHGCIRVGNENIERLAHVLPLGTPIDVRVN